MKRGLRFYFLHNESSGGFVVKRFRPQFAPFFYRRNYSTNSTIVKHTTTGVSGLFSFRIKRRKSPPDKGDLGG